MKILFLTHTFPLPANDGMRSTCYQIIKNISRKHKAYLLCLEETEVESKYRKEMLQYCSGLEIVRHSIPRSPMERIKNVLSDPTPFCVTQFYSEAFANKLKDWIAREKFDLIHFLSINVSGYRDSAGDTPCLLFPHDSVSMQFYRNALREPNFLRKSYLHIQSRKMKAYEKTMIPKFTRTVMVCEVDRKWIREFLPRFPIEIIPGGVDPEQFHPLDCEEQTPTVIFRGVMNFTPNVDAVLYFHSRVMPLILKEVPDLQFYAVGKDPSPAVKRIHDGKHTFITGVVDDLRPFMARAQVNLCPMRSGSGMKNKILEAWAMEKAVVATTLACDGIEFEDGKHLLIADDPATFANKVVELIKNPVLRKELGKNGREQAIAKYTWAHVADLFENCYNNMMLQNRPEEERAIHA